MKTLESTYGHHFCEVDRGGMTLALPLATPRWSKSLIWMVVCAVICEPVSLFFANNRVIFQ